MGPCRENLRWYILGEWTQTLWKGLHQEWLPSQQEKKQQEEWWCTRSTTREAKNPMPSIRERSKWAYLADVLMDWNQVFSAKRTLRSLLTRVKGKPPIEQTKGVVYEVSCECGETYIGETRRIQKEHKYAISWWDTTNGIAVHANTHNHQIL